MRRRNTRPTSASSAPNPTLVAGGYDSTLFCGQVDSDFLCCICHDVLRNPVEAYNANPDPDAPPGEEPCCHLFCRDCVTKWLESKQSCPQCRKLLLPVHLHRAVRLQRKIWQLPVRCRNAERGCEDTGALGRDGSWWAEHESTECEFVEVPCGHCSSAVLKRDLPAHVAQECLFRPVQCEHCAKVVKFSDLEEHMDDCPAAPMPCPNQCTQPDSSKPLVLSRVELRRHLLDECPRATISCPHAPFGCTFQGLRAEVDQHCRDQAQSHMRMTATTMTALTFEVQNLNQTVDLMHKQNNQLRRQIGLQALPRPTSLSLLKPSSAGPDDDSDAPDGSGSDSGPLLLPSTSTGDAPIGALSRLVENVYALPSASSAAPDFSMRRSSSMSGIISGGGDQVGDSSMRDLQDVDEDDDDEAWDAPSLNNPMMRCIQRVDELEEMLHVPGRIEWVVPNWSAQPCGHRIYSPVLRRGAKRWRGTVEKKEDGTVSMFLRYEKGPRPLHVRLVLMVMPHSPDPEDENAEQAVVTSSLTHTYVAVRRGGFQGWGCNRFCTLDQLIKRGGYDPRSDAIRFRIEFTVDTKRLKLEQDMSVVCRRLDLLEQRGNIPACIEWTLGNWKSLPAEVSFFSPIALRNGKRWRGSIEKKRGGHVSVYLRYEKGYRPLKVKFKLMLLDQDRVPMITRELCHTYSRFEDGGYTGWGYHKFCTLADLEEKNAYNEEHDSVTVRIEFVGEELPAPE